MASNEILIKVKLDQDGSFKLVEQQAKKAAKATDNLGKARNRYNKGEKGVIGATANGTKAFSKMRESMTGSTGLVSAYAVLASNVFAATAAFNAFRRAAQIEQLEKGLIRVGAAAGSNLPYLANQLKAVTGEALSAEQAMRATALASASGFSSKQLTDLAKVAKGASLALGRDMGDAFDRLVRGTAKVEPEILDELGIFVRLDDAVRRYADSLEVSEQSLTQYERSQAFLNATIEQGLKKYEDLTSAIDSNPYDKLSASLANLQKEVLEVFNNFAGLSNVVDFASRNLLSLTAVGTTLGAAVTGSVAPGLLRMAESSAESAEGLFNTRLEMSKTITSGGKLTPKLQELSSKLDDGTATAKDFGSAHASMLGKVGANTREMNLLSKEVDKNGNVTKKAQKRINALTQANTDLGVQMGTLKDLQQAQTTSSIAASRASSLANASNLNLIAAFKDLGQAYREDDEATTKANESKKGFNKSLRMMGPLARSGAGAIKILGAAFFAALPYIGIAITLVTTLYGLIKEKFFPEDIVKKRLDEATKSFESFSETAQAFNDSSAAGGTRLVNSYIAYTGVLDQLIGRLREMKALQDEDTAAELIQAARKKKTAEDEIAAQEALRAEILKTGKVPSSVPQIITGTARGSIQQRERTVDEALNLIDTRIGNIQTRIDEATETETSALGKRAEANAELAKTIINGYLDQFAVAKMVAEEGSGSPFDIAVAESDIAKIEALLAGVGESVTELEFRQLLRDLELIKAAPSGIREAFQQLPDAMVKANSAISKVSQKVRKPFADVEDGLQGIINLSNKVSLLEKTAAGDPAKQKEFNALTKELDEVLKGVKVPKEITDEFGTGEAAAKEFLSRVREIQESLAKLAKESAELSETSKAITEATKGIAGSEILSLTAQNDARNKQIELLNKEIEGLMLISDTDAEHAKAVESIAQKQAQVVKLTEQNLKTKEIELLAEQSLLKLTKQRNRLAAAKVENDLKSMRLEAMAQKGFISAADEAKFAAKSARDKINAAKLEYSLLEAQFALRVKLLEVQLSASGVEKETREEILNMLNDELVIQRQIADEKIRGAALDAGAGFSGPRAGVAPDERPSPLARIAGTVDSELGGVLGNTANMYDRFSAAGANLANAQSNLTERQADQSSAASALSDYQAENPYGPPDAQEEQLQAAFDAAKLRTEEATRASQAALAEINATTVSMYTGLLETQAKAMATLGPEGQVAAAFTMFSANMLTSFEAFAETAETSADRTAAAFQMAAAAINGVANIMNAKNQAAISAIDDQIAAEKKRDGKSAQSLQRINSLEKKKEAAKKKAFEQNKKMQMAQVIISTAAGIASSYAAAASAAAAAGPAAPAVFASVAAMMNGIIIATGALQLGLIASTSYQGGGGIPNDGGGAASSITLGSRRNSVDLARSQSARGELAYFRGEAGTGGPENFRNAFSGYKNRAEGGNTAFMVGEQGPEMFVPEVPGTIVANDDIQPSGPTNISFNINTVDAAGVEDLLIRQQGNIIGMIREAANSYGQDFVETVDTSVFNDTTSGVSRY